MNKFRAWLQSEHDAIMGCEAAALKALQTGDKVEYENRMRQKAASLAELADKAREHLADLPEPVADKVAATLSSYSGNASMSLRLNSVFFMSALLYKDDHKTGEPDNLQALIDTLPGEEP